MQKLHQFWEWATQSTKHKVALGVSIFVIIEAAVYLVRKRQLRNEADKNPKKGLQVIDRSYVMEDLVNEPSTTYEQENPLLGHSKQLIANFLEKLRNSQSLRPFFHEEMLKEGSNYSRNLQIHIMNSMGGPYREFEVNLKKVHKGLKISRESYREWVRLWTECERELGITGKDIWGELQEQVVF